MGKQTETRHHDNSDGIRRLETHQYNVEIATAIHEAGMARLKTVIEMLLNPAGPRNIHLAKAIKTLAEGEFAGLEKSMAQLVEVSNEYFGAIGPRVVSEANSKRVEELCHLTDRYFAYFEANFPTN